MPQRSVLEQLEEFVEKAQAAWKVWMAAPYAGNGKQQLVLQKAFDEVFAQLLQKYEEAKSPGGPESAEPIAAERPFDKVRAKANATWKKWMDSDDMAPVKQLTFQNQFEAEYKAFIKELHVFLKASRS